MSASRLWWLIALIREPTHIVYEIVFIVFAIATISGMIKAF